MYTVTDGVVKPMVKNRNGESFECSNFRSIYQLMGQPLPYANQHQFGVLFGTGGSPVTADDVWLSGSMVTNLSCSAAETNGFDESGAWYAVKYTLTNNNSEAVTIKEIGLASTYSSAASSQSHSVLIERTLLDAPITIEPGGTGVIDYKIQMNYPT